MLPHAFRQTVIYISTDCSAFYFRDKQPNGSVLEQWNLFSLTKETEVHHSPHLGAAGDTYNTHKIYKCRYNSVYAQ